MKVYIVQYYDYDEVRFEGVFSTQELAEVYVEKQKNNKDIWHRVQHPNNSGWDIEEWVVDSEG